MTRLTRREIRDRLDRSRQFYKAQLIRARLEAWHVTEILRTIEADIEDLDVELELFEDTPEGAA